MITIVILHWNRHPQLINTLHSFTHSASRNFNVVIVDNKSDTEFKVPPLPYEVRLIRLTNQLYSKSFISAHNYGFYYALKEMNPDKIIIQHSECCHAGDVISYAEGVTDKSYISFGCYSIGKGDTPETTPINNRAMTFDGDSAWYNHPIYRPRNTHFCSAITAANLRKLNGFDERFCEGAWFDDDYFLLQVQRLGLKIDLTSDPFVFHQNHEIIWGDSAPIFKNRDIYNIIKHETGYKAQHFLTPDFDENN